MAEIAPTIVASNINGLSVVWSSVTENDTFGVLNINDGFADMSISVEGTFNGASITIEGSLGGSHREPVVDSNGVIMQFSAASNIRPVGPAVTAIQPVRSGGSSTSVNVYLYYTKRRG